MLRAIPAPRHGGGPRAANRVRAANREQPIGSLNLVLQFAIQALAPMVKVAPLTRSFTGSVKPAGHAAVPFAGIFYQGTGAQSLGIGTSSPAVNPAPSPFP